MFDTRDYKQRKPEEAHRKGAQKAQQTGPLEDAMDGLANLVFPDSMGADEYKSHKRAYRDHFSGQVKGPAPTPRDPEKPVVQDASGKAWYALGDRREFIPEEIVRYYQQQLLNSSNSMEGGHD